MIAALLAAAMMLLQPTGPRVIVQFGHDTFLNGTIIEHIDGSFRLQSTDGEEVLIDPGTVMGVLELIEVDTPPPARVQLRTGRIIRGTLLADDWTSIRMRVQGVDMTIPRSDVTSLRLDPDIEAIFRRERALLDDDDEGGRLQLAKWLMANKSWALASTELDDIATKFNSFEARRLVQRARAFAALESTPAAPSPKPTKKDTNVPALSPGEVPAEEPSPPHRLELPSDDIVHLVRVLELDTVHPPPVRIGEATRKRLHLGWGGNRLLSANDEGLRTLLAMTDAKVLQLMFNLRARPLYGEIEVLEPPESLQQFKTAVHDSWLVTKCGTRGCHGGVDGGRFRLLRRSRVDDRLRTANLLQLERTNIDNQPLLNWATPADSLLIQYALPRDQANKPHPRVPGWRPALDNKRLTAVLQWIRSMRQPRPTIAWPPEAPAAGSDPTQPSDDVDTPSGA